MSTILEITDFSAPELDVYARLTENQLVNRADPEHGMFVAESPLVIQRALDAGCVPVSFLMEYKHITGKGSALLEQCKGVPVYAAELEVLTQLTGFHLTRGMLCAMYRPKLPTVQAVCAGARRVAVLENVMNPTNIGAIFRSAAALGMDAVLLTSAGSDPLYRRAVRVSMGTVFQVTWMRTGRRRSGSWAFRPPPWRCGRIRCPSRTPVWTRRSVWRWCWAPRGTAWPPIPLPGVITPFVFLCPMEWTPSTWRRPAPWPFTSWAL